MAFSPDGKTLATGAGDGMVQLWNPETGQNTAIVTGRYQRKSDLTGSWSFGGVSCVAFSPDSKTIAIADGYKTVRLWNLPTG